MEASSFSTNLREKDSRLQELEAFLCASLNVTSDEIKGQCKTALVTSSLQKLQEKIEMTYLVMQRRHSNIQKAASKC